MEIIVILLLLAEKTPCNGILNLPFPWSFQGLTKKEHLTQLFSHNFVLPLIVSRADENYRIHISYVADADTVSSVVHG